MSYSRTSVAQLGENKGKARVYMQGQWLARAGFEPGSKINVTFADKKVIITRTNAGGRKVSGKMNNTIPVIDITGDDLAATLCSAEKLQISCRDQVIEITPAYTVMLARSRELVPTEASLFSGGGFLSLAAKMCGFEPKVAVEMNDDYAEIFERNHPGVHMFNNSIEQVPWDELKRFRPIGLLTMGIPCEPYTMIRRLDRGGQTKRDKSLPPEAHELGDMVFWGLRGIEALNPHSIVIEEVPKFLESGAGYILLHALRRLYPHVETKLLDPFYYGSLSGRARACIIASNNPITWPTAYERPPVRVLSEIFDPEPHEWFTRETKNWLYAHWEKQTAKGNGFASQEFHADSPYVGTIKKRYFAQQGDNPVIKHQTKPNTHRWLTLNEVKRLHGIPADYYTGSSKTIAGEVMGQGVVVDMFKKVIATLTGRQLVGT